MSYSLPGKVIILRIGYLTAPIGYTFVMFTDTN